MYDPTTPHRRYRVPRGEGEWLIEPPFAAAEPLVQQARERLDASACEIGGRRLGELRQLARQSFLAAARAYTGSYADVPGDINPSAPLIVGGHQAELFHPGVWFKNFVLGRLAEQMHGTAVHLVIDTDVCRSASIRVPSGSIDAPSVQAISFDRPRTSCTFESWKISDCDLFKGFPTRVSEALVPLPGEPLLGDLWRDTRSQLAACDGRWGWAIARARHRLEAAWGNRTLELPQSLVCQLPEVRWLLATVLQQLPRFHDCYNGALAQYRRGHRLRSPAQPLPDLATDGDWFEAPLWVYTSDDPRRRTLWARAAADDIELTDRGSWRATLSQNPELACQQWAELEQAGVCLRTRALTTTLVARLLLGDLFVHGIGGAKYDEVTTGFATTFFDVEPSAYLAATATLLLPIEHHRVTPRDIGAIDRQLRDARYHPETLLPQELPRHLAEVVSGKREWFARPVDNGQAHARHVAIEQANHALQLALEPQIATWRRDREGLVDAERASRILSSRDFAFCLYGADDLRERMNQVVDSATAGI